MQGISEECNAYIIDTCKISRRGKGKYVPGAIAFKGRKKMQILQWKNSMYTSQEKADAFVRMFFSNLGIAEVENEGELQKYR